MKTPNKEQIEILRKRYRPGTVVELTSAMEDPYHPLPAGLRGEVRGVDDAGQIMMSWNGGGSLSLIPGVDSFRVVEETPKPVMSEQVREQILSLRLHPEAPNMFSVNEVQILANRLGYFELVVFLAEHRKEYVHFILTGKSGDDN